MKTFKDPKVSTSTTVTLICSLVFLVAALVLIAVDGDQKSLICWFLGISLVLAYVTFFLAHTVPRKTKNQ